MAYLDYECEISKSRLREIFTSVKGPVCLLGGWAVFLTANERFSKEHGYEYSGSRDIDLGFHVDPRWSRQELGRSAIAQSSRILEGSGFTGLGSRFMMHYDVDTKRPLPLEKSVKVPMHQIFPLYVDLMGDSTHADAREVIGFPLLAEPRLAYVFGGGESASVEDMGCRFVLPSPWILAATKISSVTGRTAGHKRYKDVSDLYAVLMYSGIGFGKIRKSVHDRLGKETVSETVEALDDSDYEGASTMCRVPKGDIETAIRALAA